MVGKVTKTKTAKSVGKNALPKKSKSKEKPEEKLSTDDGEKEISDKNTDVNPDLKTNGSDKNLDTAEETGASASDVVHGGETNAGNQEEMMDVKTAPVSRSRRVAADVKGKKATRPVRKQDTKEQEIETVAEKDTVDVRNVPTDDKKPARAEQKRKAAADTNGKATKAKKQKFHIDVPKISSISGKVFVIGENDVGQLGFEEGVETKEKPTPLSLPYSVVDIAAGGMHSVCLTESGEVLTFGCNDEGALGRITLEDTDERTPLRVDIAERIVQVSAGDSHSAALSESGNVYVWGNFRNNNGPMGLVADGIMQKTPVRILNDITVVKISSGSEHLVCLSQEGVVYTCGGAEAGQLGRVAEYRSADGGRRGKKLLLEPGVVSVSRANTTSNITNIWTGSYTTFLNVKERAEKCSVYGFGLNNYHQLGLQYGTTIFKPKKLGSFDNKTWSQVDGGQHHTLALDNDGVVYSLGRSEYGRLGLGGGDSGNGVSEAVPTSVPTSIPSLQKEKCVNISCGNCISLAVTDDGSVYTWGMGTNFQLGHGDDKDQNVPVLISNMKSKWKAIKISGGGQHTLILAVPSNSSDN